MNEYEYNQMMAYRQAAMQAQLWNIPGNPYSGVVNMPYMHPGSCLETKNGITKEININDIEPLEGVDDPIRIEIQSEVKLKLVEL